MTGPEEEEVRLPVLRDVLHHLVHHAPGLSPEMRGQFMDAIDEVFPEGPGGVVPARDGKAAPPGTPAPGLDPERVASAASSLALAEAAVDALVTPVPAPEAGG